MVHESLVRVEAWLEHPLLEVGPGKRRKSSMTEAGFQFRVGAGRIMHCWTDELAQIVGAASAEREWKEELARGGGEGEPAVPG